jgi:hypothetical protein
MSQQIEGSAVFPIEQLMFLSSLLIVWAMLRPNTIRDYDGRRLPNNTTARAILGLFYMVIFAGLTMALHKFGEKLVPTLEQMSAVGHLAASLKGQAPMLAILALCTLWQLAVFRDLERSFVITLHSARHLNSDSELLSQHLIHCDFKPSEIERARNLNDLRKFGVYVKDDGKWDYDMVTVGNWRKVSTLLRLLKSWNPEEQRSLSKSDMALIHDIATAHDRKTQLAMTIIKMLEMVAEGRKPAAALSEVMDRLTSTRQLDRGEVATAEAEAGTLLEGGPSEIAKDTIRLSIPDLQKHLVQIERYFETEYEILLENAVRLTSKSVALAGESAPSRLEELKSLGFSGLGYIERINFDRILWLFLVGALGGFLVMVVGNFQRLGTGAAQANPIMLAQFAFSMTLAGLVGAVVGSSRNLANAPSAPWTSYVGAGLISGCLFMAVALISNYIRFDLLQTKLPEGVPIPTPRRMLAWSVLPFVTTIGVCVLGRLKRWPDIPSIGYTPITERAVDGAVISAVLFAGWCLSIGLTLLFGLPLPPRMQQLIAENAGSWFPIPVLWPLQTLGFLIGFFFVRTVRRAAHATIVDPAAVPRSAPRVIEANLVDVTYRGMNDLRPMAK